MKGWKTYCMLIGGGLSKKSGQQSELESGRASQGALGFSCREGALFWGGQSRRRVLGDGAQWIQGKCEELARRPKAGAWQPGSASMPSQLWPVRAVL